MKCKDMFLESLESLLFSWDSEYVPHEIILTFNSFIDFLNEEENLTIPHLEEDLSNYEIIDEELHKFEES